MTMTKHPIYEPLDPEIAPLIEAMNRHDWLDTVSSCFGQPGQDPGRWYVSFWCRMDRVGALCAFLNSVAGQVEVVRLIELHIVWPDEVAEAQIDAGPDWLSLDMATIPEVYLTKPERLELTERLAQAFNELAQA